MQFFPTNTAESKTISILSLFSFSHSKKWGNNFQELPKFGSVEGNLTTFYFSSLIYNLLQWTPLKPGMLAVRIKQRPL